MNRINFKYHSAHNGFCRVYYTANRRLYCLQASHGTEFEMLSCSQDGEPSCPIRPEAIGNIEMPKGDESIEAELTAFLQTGAIINSAYANSFK